MGTALRLLRRPEGLTPSRRLRPIIESEIERIETDTVRLEVRWESRRVSSLAVLSLEALCGLLDLSISQYKWELLLGLLVGLGGLKGTDLVAATVEDPTFGTGRTILVAEDEVLVRLDISDYLRAHGYNVIEANSAAEAVQVLKNDLEVALVFTDVRMPGTVDGIDLARYVQNHHPHVPVVITSGHVSPKEVPGSLGPFIAKPYDRARVLETIEQQLRQREEK